MIATLFGIYRQVDEMVKVYEPILTQAESAKTQAEAAKGQSEAAKTQADIALQTFANSRDDIAVAQRAWVGPTGAQTENTVGLNTELKLVVNYQNSGKQPAINVVFTTDNFVAPENDWNAALRIQRNMADCKIKPPVEGSQVIYPSSGFVGNQLRSSVTKDLISQDVVDGKKVVILTGCFAYQSFEKPRHSAFCFFFKNGVSPGSNLNFCPNGSYVD